jgi:tetratricopeptide (TPR) repeat protein
VAFVAFLISAAWCQSEADWQHRVREMTQARQFDAALQLAEQRLAEAPGDLEARGWHGRVLAWQGHWAEAESDYRAVIARAPDDVDMLSGLADVLHWQGKTKEALAFADRACGLAPTQPDLLLRRARILRALGDRSQARRQYRAILYLDPENQEAKRELAGLSEETKHELRIGTDIDTFNYTDAAQAQSLLVTSRWTRRWSTAFGSDFYQRFGQDAGKFVASSSFRFTQHNWLSAGGSAGHDNGVIPKREAFFEYGHGFHISNGLIRGLEASYQQRWLWYQGAHVLTVGATQLYYLPKDWTWTLTVTGARSGFAGTGVEWVPSGSTRLAFPLPARFRGNLSFAVGSENFAQVDEIGRFSARTYGGGLKYRIAARQDVSGYIAVQDRTQGRTQNSYGLSYGLRF